MSRVGGMEFLTWAVGELHDRIIHLNSVPSGSCMSNERPFSVDG